MKATTVAKVNPIAEILTPTLLQCKSGVCGGCPNNTGKMLWIPETNASYTLTLTFRYNFFDITSASTTAIKYNLCGGFNTATSSNFSYTNPPDKAWAIANNAIASSPSLSPSLMVGAASLTNLFNIPTTGAWLFFRQPNPAIANIHDALCFEYNNERKLITFRSF